LDSGQLQIPWSVQLQAASTDHRAFDQQDGTSSSLALDVNTAFDLPKAWRATSSSRPRSWIEHYRGMPENHEVACLNSEHPVNK
jgi:hypothetical protein